MYAFEPETLVDVYKEFYDTIGFREEYLHTPDLEIKDGDVFEALQQAYKRIFLPKMTASLVALNAWITSPRDSEFVMYSAFGYPQWTLSLTACKDNSVMYGSIALSPPLEETIGIGLSNQLGMSYDFIVLNKDGKMVLEARTTDLDSMVR